MVHHAASCFTLFPLISLATWISANIHRCTPPSTEPTLPARRIPMQSKCLWVAKMPLLGHMQLLPRAGVPFPQPHTVGCSEHRAVCRVPAPSAGHGAVMRAGSGYRQGCRGLLGQSFEECLPSLQWGALNQPVRWKEQKSPQNREGMQAPEQLSGRPRAAPSLLGLPHPVSHNAISRSDAFLCTQVGQDDQCVEMHWGQTKTHCLDRRLQRSWCCHLDSAWWFSAGMYRCMKCPQRAVCQPWPSTVLLVEKATENAEKGKKK